MKTPLPLGLIETMRAKSGGIALLDSHMERLQTSSEAVGIPCEIEEVRLDVQDHVSRLGGDLYRVRLALERKGEYSISSDPLDDALFETASLYPDAIREAGSVVCTHKTMERSHYRAAQEWANARGADEAILINAAGQVFDATRSTVWIESGGMLLTPPLDAGGLPGVMRRSLLTQRDNASERKLSPEDLLSAERVYLSNAVRGLMRVQLV